MGALTPPIPARHPEHVVKETQPDFRPSQIYVESCTGMAVTPVTLGSTLRTLLPSAAWQAVLLAHWLEPLLLVNTVSTVYCLVEVY